MSQHGDLTAGSRLIDEQFMLPVLLPRSNLFFFYLSMQNLPAGASNAWRHRVD
jgi:hypothetical protein